MTPRISPISTELTEASFSRARIQHKQQSVKRVSPLHSGRYVNPRCIQLPKTRQEHGISPGANENMVNRR